MRLSRIASWTTKGGLAILDQGLFAGTNFVANILLARWLSPAQYGAFALAFSVFVFVSMFHTALITEPLMVFGPGKYLARFEQYLGVVFRANFALTLPLGLLVLAAGLVTGFFYAPLVGWALAGAALATPCILFLWVGRRAFYVHLRPAWAAVGGALYLVIFVSLLALLRVAHFLTPATALAAMGGAALAVGTMLAFRSRPRWRRAPDGPGLRDVAADHWRLGSWSVASVPVAWLPGGIYYALLPVWFGLAEAGALKALMNFAMPVLQSVTALGVLLLPLLVRHRRQGGTRRMSATLRRFLALFLSGGAIYGVFLWAFRLQLLRLLYAGRYTEYSGLPVLLVALLALVACAGLPFGSALLAVERSDLVFRSNLAAAVATVVCGVPLAALFGLTGALAGMLIAWAVLGLSNFLLYRAYALREEAAAAGHLFETAVEAP